MSHNHDRSAALIAQLAAAALQDQKTFEALAACITTCCSPNNL